MERYDPFPLRSTDGYEEHYAVRVGGIGGRLVGERLELDRYRADLLCEMLRQAYEAGVDFGWE